MPLGSKVALIFRINSISTGCFACGRRSRFNRPMPCSALIEPPRSSTISIDGGVERVPMAQEDRAIHAGRLTDIVVDVAVAEMTEGHGPRARDHQLDEPIGARDKLRHARDRHGDVVLDRCRPLASAPRSSARAGATAPACASDAATTASSISPASMPSPSTLSTRRASSSPWRGSSARISTYQGCGAAEGSRTGCRGGARIETDARHDFEGRQRRPAWPRARAKKASAVSSGSSLPCGHRSTGLGKSLQHRSGDDAERSLRTDEQVLEIVTGIVLAQRPQPVPHAPVGEAPLRARASVAGVAVAQHAMPPALVESIAADLAASFRGELKGNRRPPPSAAAAAPGEHEPASTVMVLSTESMSRTRLRRSARPRPRGRLERDLPADQPGIAALRHDGRLRRVGVFQDRRDLSRFAGLERESGSAAIAVSPFDEIARHVRLIANGVLLADDALDASMVSRLGGARCWSRVMTMSASPLGRALQAVVDGLARPWPESASRRSPRRLSGRLRAAPRTASPPPLRDCRSG